MKNIVQNIKNTKNKINAIDFDAHWYRRVFHTFGASFIAYYMLPDVEWINNLKIIIPVLIFILALSLEVLRVTGKISGSHFFGLRMYEQKRIGSHLFFAIGIVILLFFFPQQIAIPCILCACIADPIMGEVRNRFGKNQVCFFGFLVCLLIFIVTWYKADIWVLILVSVVGAFGAVLGEVKKFYWLDDDFMIQILPAILILLLCFVFNMIGTDILPDPVIYPGQMPW